MINLKSNSKIKFACKAINCSNRVASFSEYCWPELFTGCLLLFCSLLSVHHVRWAQIIQAMAWWTPWPGSPWPGPPWWWQWWPTWPSSPWPTWTRWSLVRWEPSNQSMTWPAKKSGCPQQSRECLSKNNKHVFPYWMHFRWFTASPQTW